MLSLNEIEGTVRKAAVGVGLAYGLASEAGRAAGWLAAAGLPALTLSADVLDAVASGDSNPGHAREDENGWTIVGTDRPLCPFRAGVAACDLLNAGASRITLKGVLLPVAAIGLFTVVSTVPRLILSRGDRSDGASIATGIVTVPEADPLETGWAGPLDLMIAGSDEDTPAETGLKRYGEPADRARVLSTGIPDEPEAMVRLKRHIAKTLVPASDASRERGAGAGRIDSH
ncbi:DUF3726 domain-containing protein [Amorphus sp. 3PC139-8]|uniref:DUF3726 domain-containing protein n=1 Tax=Amorphus sp. 3PC139-8 TaxID=2735676 RepID=UPI00345D60FC